MGGPSTENTTVLRNEAGLRATVHLLVKLARQITSGLRWNTVQKVAPHLGIRRERIRGNSLSFAFYFSAPGVVGIVFLLSAHLDAGQVVFILLSLKDCLLIYLIAINLVNFRVTNVIPRSSDGWHKVNKIGWPP